MTPDNNPITIVGYDSRYADDFKRLNEAWIKDHFEIEETDLEILNHPEDSIIQPGGEIFFALENGMVIGTCALIRVRGKKRQFELAKMAVNSDFRRRGIGHQLGLAVIQRAREVEAECVYLESNTVLAPAIHLYKKLGFKEASLQPTPYCRCNIRMELDLSEHGRSDTRRMPKRKLNYHLLDVFTDRQFGGNPLAVFPEADGLTDEQMQAIAGELNLSETVFLKKPREGTSDCTVRIFTPKTELPMAGHPTIGAAWAVLKNAWLKPQRSTFLMFDEAVGPVQVDYTIEGDSPSELAMHQPLPEFGETLDKDTIARLLLLESTDILREAPVQIVSCGVPVILVPLKSLDAVQRAQPRLDQMSAALAGVDCHELFVFTCATEDAGSDVHCRFFAHRFGIPEDPASGAAHGPLGAYLVKYGLNDGNRIVSEQGIEMGRPSTINVRIETQGDEITGVFVGGDCVEMGTGTIRIDHSDREMT